MPDATPREASSIEKPTGIRLTPLADFLAEHDEATRWIVDGLLPHGGSSVLVAKPKAGKSTLARALLAAMVRGHPFLDRACTPGPVVYLAIEEKRSELRRQLVDLGLSREPVYIHTGSIDERAMPAIDQVTRAIETTGAQLVIIDPLYKFVRIKDGNDYAEVSRILEPITDLGRRSGCHIQAVHHATKAGEGQDAILGSTALAAAVDTMILLKRDGQVRTLRTIQRYGDDLEEVVLARDDTGQIGVSGSAFDQQVAVIETHVLEAVTEGAFTETQIVARVTGDTNLIRFALRRLVMDGFVVKKGQGKRGSPYEYFPRSEGA